MRYECARATQTSATTMIPQRVWFSGPLPPAAPDLCHDARGTGCNDPSRRPRPRFGNAASGRGDCFHQIHVSDEFPATNRE
jgi:hypothetical protein